MQNHYNDDGYFIAPHAGCMRGDENGWQSTRALLSNPVAAFGPDAYARPFVSNRSFGKMMHVITDPDIINEVFLKRLNDFPKSPMSLRLLRSVTRFGLLGVEGDRWKRQRKAVASIFRPKALAPILPMSREVLKEWAGSVEFNDSSQLFELGEVMTELTFGILAKSLLGDPKGMDAKNMQMATGTIVKSAGRIRLDDVLIPPSNLPRPMGLKAYLALRRLRAVANQLLDQPFDEAGEPSLVDLLSHAKTGPSGEGLSRKEQVDNLLGFFIAGHETTALTMTWMMYLLSRHGPSLDRVRAEIKTVVGDGDLTFDQIPHLQFCRAVIDETMRLFPSAPMTGRMALKSCKIKNCSMEVGDLLIIPFYILHRTPRLWDDPHVFKPQRFIDDPDLNKGRGKFMPFGGGPRVCVGAAFAITEAMALLVDLARNYDFDIDPSIYPTPNMKVTLYPQGGIAVRIKKR